MNDSRTSEGVAPISLPALEEGMVLKTLTSAEVERVRAGPEGASPKDGSAEALKEAEMVVGCAGAGAAALPQASGWLTRGFVNPRGSRAPRGFEGRPAARGFSEVPSSGVLRSARRVFWIAVT
jgi:hypothetical protein